VFAEVTAAGRAALDRIRRHAEAHLADVLAPLDAASRRRLRAGLNVLKQAFAQPPSCTEKAPAGRRSNISARASYVRR
jgi:hypothetical protein